MDTSDITPDITPDSATSEPPIDGTERTGPFLGFDPDNASEPTFTIPSVPVGNTPPSSAPDDPTEPSATRTFPTPDVPGFGYTPPQVPESPRPAPSVVIPETPTVKARKPYGWIAAGILAVTTIGSLITGMSARSDLADAKSKVASLEATVKADSAELDKADKHATDLAGQIETLQADADKAAADLADAKDEIDAATAAGASCASAADLWKEQALRLAQVLDALASQDVDTAKSLMAEVQDNSQAAIDDLSACHNGI